MHSSDIFVLLDDVAFSKNSIENRNLVKTPKGKLWLTVPVRTKGRYGQLIKDTEIDNSKNWAEKHWKSISLNYGRAKFFPKHAPFFETLYSTKWSRLIDLNVKIIDYVANSFGIKTKTVFCSSLEVSEKGTIRLVNICKKLGADTYLSGIGARAYQDDSLFERAGIKILYQHFTVRPYPQLYGGFLPNLSAIDYVFNCNAEGAFNME